MCFLWVVFYRNISAWNLKEQDIWFDSLDEPAAREDRPFRICSYHSGFDVCKVSSQKRHLWGASVDVLFSKSTLGDSSFGNVSKNQVYNNFVFHYF